jgi:hypothetical protein
MAAKVICSLEVDELHHTLEEMPWSTMEAHADQTRNAAAAVVVAHHGWRRR